MKIKITRWREGMTPEAGKIYQGMPNLTYHGFRDWNGSSMLKHALRSVESYLYEKERPEKYTMAMEKGAALHWSIEAFRRENDDLFENKILESPTTTLGVKWKKMKTEYPDCYILPDDERKAVGNMGGNLAAHANGLELLHDGLLELSCFWIDPDTRIKCKCRPDLTMFPNQSKRADGHIADWKTTKNHSRDGFDREMLRYGYHFSAAMYMEGMKQVTGWECPSFVFGVCNNTPPHETEFYPFGENSFREGHALFRQTLFDIANYEEVKTEEHFAIQPPLDIPRYGFKLTEPFYGEYSA